MMFNFFKKIIFLIFIIPCIDSFASSAVVTYYGDMRPGGFMVARSSGIERAVFEGKEIKTDGKYVTVGFDRDDRGSRTLELFFYDGSTERKSIKLPERDYAIQHVRGLQAEHVSPGPEHTERIQRERDVMRNAIYQAGRKENAYFSSGIVRPVEGGRITSVFGSQRILDGVPGTPHNGIDIALPQGTPVHAMAAGVVLLADDFFFAGKYVMIAHGQGLISFYMHLSKIDVIQGQRVYRGDKIGELGMTGRATGPHLHWGVQWNSSRIDPALLLHTGIGQQGSHFIRVSVAEQKLHLYGEGELIKSYPVSTSRYGTGSESGSYKTPAGLHRVARKIGDGALVGSVFRGRVRTGEVTEIYYDGRSSDGDYILTRILRLEGLEPGINKGEEVDSYSRFIYIHGTKEEGLIGRPVSRGCVRMRNEDVIELFNIVEEGTLVEIIP